MVFTQGTTGGWLELAVILKSAALAADMTAIAPAATAAKPRAVLERILLFMITSST
jgi:hypothetical protein